MYIYPAECDAGLVKLTTLSTMNPNKKLTNPEVPIIAYWIPCSV